MKHIGDQSNHVFVLFHFISPLALYLVYKYESGIELRIYPLTREQISVYTTMSNYAFKLFSGCTLHGNI